MKRFVLFVAVCLIGVSAYLWYRGDAGGLLRKAKEFVIPPPSTAAPRPAKADESQVSLQHAVFKYDRLAEALRSTDPAQRVAAWEELSKVYLRGGEKERERVLPALRSFVNTYVLSSRFPSDTRVAARVNVQPGDRLARIAKRYGTTIEAIMRLNHLKSEIIRPGMTLKVLNQPIAIFVQKSRYRLWVTYGGKFLFEAPCGIGIENRTPSGTFIIADRIKNPEWYRPDGRVIPPGDPENELGSRWLGFKDTPEYSGLGIHEARNPSDVGKESSKGCLRLRKEDIELLFDITPLGTKVTILE